jgi:hypothetical protein
MSAIVPASWEDLGYRRLGPITPGDANGLAVSQSIAKILKDMVSHETMASVHYWDTETRQTIKPL